MADQSNTVLWISSSVVILWDWLNTSEEADMQDSMFIFHYSFAGGFLLDWEIALIIFFFKQTSEQKKTDFDKIFISLLKWQI